jgi:type VI secretion system Hcp family effector
MTVTTLRRTAALLVLALAATLVLLLRPHVDAHALTAAAAEGPRPTISGSCKGQQQGLIKGSSKVKGRTDTYDITGLTHGIGQSVDDSGTTFGRLEHQPIRFTMAVDRSTVQFIRAEAVNENLTTCAFNFYRRSPDGVKDIVYLRLDLRDAHVVDYALNGRQGGPDVVTFKLAYRTVQWTYPEGGLMASSDWWESD